MDSRNMWKILQDMFPRHPYSAASLRRTIWYIFTRHSNLVNTITSFTLIVGVAHIVIKNRFIELGDEDVQLLAHRTIWVILLCVSLLCCYYYAKLVCNYRLTLLFEQSQQFVVIQVMVVLLCLGLLSVYSLVHQVQLAGSEEHSVNLNWLWKFVFTATAFAGVLQRILATTFVCIALPVAKRWVSEMKPDVKSTILELLPWKIFLFLHRNLLSTFFEKPLSSLKLYEDSVYIVGFGFRCFCMLWLLFVALYVGYDFALPCKYDSQPRGRRELAGVCGMVLDYPPKSQVVTGLSPRHYARRYSGFPSNGETEREMKAQMRTNAVAHEQYRILHSQLD